VRQVAEDWEAAEDSEVEAEKAKKAAEAKAKADAEALANKKSKAQRIEEKRQANMRRKLEEDEESSSDEDESEKRERLRRTEQDSDLKHAEDLFGNIGVKDRNGTKSVVSLDPSDPTKAVDLAGLPLFNPSTKDSFGKLREALVPILAANSKKAHYIMFMQEFTKQICKDLPSDQIKKIASSLTALSNEKMKEEKLAEKGGRKTKASKTKSALVATRDVSSRADTTAYGGDDFDE
jgi:translation initiation factor 3 subunit J